MDTDDYHKISTTYGLDSQIVANFYKAFASYFGLPKEGFKNYHEPYKDESVSHISKGVEVNVVDRIIPEPYIEKVPFPNKIKEHTIITGVVSKSNKKTT